MNYSNLVLKIKKRPGMFLSTFSTYTLKAFLDGYRYSVEENETSTVLDTFQIFIVDKYKASSTLSWDNIIRMYSSSDYQAFKKFFELFDEFLEQ